MAKNPDEQDASWIAHKERTAEPRMSETAFTEIFLQRFSGQDAWAVRRFGQLLDDASMELQDYSATENESFTRCDLRALLADLRRLEHELADVGRSPEDSVIEDREDLKLCRLATRKAFAVARIADAIEKAIGPAPQAEKRSDRRGGVHGTPTFGENG